MRGYLWLETDALVAASPSAFGPATVSTQIEGHARPSGKHPGSDIVWGLANGPSWTPCGKGAVSKASTFNIRDNKYDVGGTSKTPRKPASGFSAQDCQPVIPKTMLERGANFNLSFR